MRNWLCLLTALACTPDAGSHREPIVHGEADVPELFPGVARVVHAPTGDFCTGTLISADAVSGHGWVLTAAHCVIPPTDFMPRGRAADTYEVVFGASVSSTNSFPVTAWHVPPDFAFDRVEIPGGFDAWPTSASPRDVALLEIEGVTPEIAATAIAVLDPASDDLAVGTPLTAVGYGQTESGNATSRRRADVQVYEIVTSRRGATIVTLDQRDGASGICFGDSGGPLIRRIGGVPYVAAITSGIVSTEPPPCTEFSSEARISEVHAWIEATIAGDPAAPPTGCLACAGVESLAPGACADELATDAADSAVFIACMRTDWSGDCRTSMPDGAAAYDRYWACLETECTGCAAADRTRGLCGYRQDGGGACDACMQASCCSEIAHCMLDTSCAPCLGHTETDDATCNEDALYRAARTCLDESCAECTPYLDALPTIVAVDVDAGGDDAGTARDDAGMPDAGSAPDAGTEPSEGGCSCGATRTGSASWAWSFAAVILAWRRRRA